MKQAALLYKLITITYLISSMKLVLMSLEAAEVAVQVEEALVPVVAEAPAVVQVELDIVKALVAEVQVEL